MKILLTGLLAFTIAEPVCAADDWRTLATDFQFEIRGGAGLRSGRLDFHIRYMHYSNGSIEQPNQWIDAFLIGMAFGF